LIADDAEPLAYELATIANHSISAKDSAAYSQRYDCLRPAQNPHTRSLAPRLPSLAHFGAGGRANTCRYEWSRPPSAA